MMLTLLISPLCGGESCSTDRSVPCPRSHSRARQSDIRVCVVGSLASCHFCEYAKHRLCIVGKGQLCRFTSERSYVMGFCSQWSVWLARVGDWASIPRVVSDKQLGYQDPRGQGWSW